MKPLNDVALNAVAISGTATNNSNPVDGSFLIAGSAQAVVTGTATGTLKLQYSNDAPGVGSPANWSDIPSASVAVSGAGVYAIAKLDLCYQWIRATYTNATNTGVLTVTIKGHAF